MTSGRRHAAGAPGNNTIHIRGAWPELRCGQCPRGSVTEVLEYLGSPGRSLQGGDAGREGGRELGGGAGGSLPDTGDIYGDSDLGAKRRPVWLEPMEWVTG